MLFLAPYYVSLICVASLSSTPLCLHYCSFMLFFFKVLNKMVWFFFNLLFSSSSSFFFPIKIFLNIIGIFPSHITFRIGRLTSIKKFPVVLSGTISIMIYSDHVGNNADLDDIESYNQWTQTISHLLRSSLIFSLLL